MTYYQRFLKKILFPVYRKLNAIEKDLEQSKILQALPLIRTMPPPEQVEALSEVEFCVSSQWGEDGIIQFLIRNVSIGKKFFVEFGVENYREANTRFLLQNNNWKGLVFDGDPGNIERILQQDISWRHDLTAKSAFITRENINSLLSGNGAIGDLGLLSIDIDGNDYWVWESITSANPRIVIVEYNSLFGPNATVSVPYDPSFVRSNAHFSCLYFGASLGAFCHLADRKGYIFVGTNSAGSNAFFVRRDVASRLRAKSAREGFVLSQSRESRDRQGRLSFVGAEGRIALISHLDLVDVVTGKTCRVGDVLQNSAGPTDGGQRQTK
jgi:hypothetical protein